MKTKITLIVERDPHDYNADNQDLEHIERLIEDDPDYLHWVLEKPFKATVEAVIE